MWTRRIEMVVVLAAGAIALGVTGLLGLRQYMGATAERLHPAPQQAPATSYGLPAGRWVGAAERGRQAVRAALSAENLPGLSVAVGAGGGLVWAEGFGWADLERRVPVSPDTRFRVGTASVALTSAAVGRLLEQRRLDLDADMTTYVPAFPSPQPMTLRQVMGHVAGLGSDGGDESPLFGVHCDRPADALPHFAGRSLRFAPGSDYRYSNFGWILVSAAVEAAAGEPFLRVVRKRVFEPAGMDATAADGAVAASDDRATSYFPRFGGDPRFGLHLMRPLDYSCYAGASGFVSTPSDLVRFGLAITGGRLLRPETVRLLQTPTRLSSGRDTEYGLGWTLQQATLGGREVRVAGHDGEVLGGMAASLLTVPELGLVVAVLSNMPYAKTSDLATRLADAFTAAARSAAP